MKRIHLLSTLAAASLLLTACAPTPAPTPASLPTAIVAVNTAPTATPSVVPTPTLGATDTPAAAATATLTPEPATPTLDPSAAAVPTYWTPIWPTNESSVFLPAPDTFGGDPHLYFGRPLGAGANIFAVGDYRFGMTRDNTLVAHHGLDYGNPIGAPVVSVGDGVVYYAGSDHERVFGPREDFYGNVIVIQLSAAVSAYAVYGHLDTVSVVSGQAVAEGEFIGTVGDRGVAAGPHLHLEIRTDNPDSYYNVVNPDLWLRPIPGHGVIAIRVTRGEGDLVPGVRVIAACSDKRYRTVDTYWYGGTLPDRFYLENAALGDIPAGPCTLTAQLDGQTLTTTVDVPAGSLAFAWLRGD
ncbi:MAG TPA: M23 family metallopeptidase [Anaerolineales bacterium]|nr:M23 family metallopeptidase [Anaerolineales bacterium]